MTSRDDDVRVLCAWLVLLLYGLSGTAATAAAVSPGSNSTESDAGALMSCFNAKYFPEPIRVETYLASKPSRSVRMHRIWWSQRSHRLPVTLFTHSDLGRLKSVEAQCRGYPGGVLSVAVWVPLIVGNASAAASSRTQRDGQNPDPAYDPIMDLDSDHVTALQSATERLERMFRAMEAPPPSPGANATAGTDNSAHPNETCVLRAMLLYELVYDDVMAALMPLNILRNAALLAATTPLVGMVDADMALSWGLSHTVLANKTRAADLERRAVVERVVWVLPIFDTDDKLPLTERMALAEAAVEAGPNPKSHLIDMWRLKSAVFPYGSRAFTPGHGPTDCERWATSVSDYPVEYRDGYEPFILGDRMALPPYDSRFRGYFRDKIVNTAYVARLGFSFRVLPDVWMVHRPHVPCMASYKWFWYHKEASKPTPLEKLVRLVNGTWVRARAANNVHSISTYNAAVLAMDAHAYQPVINEATVHCRAVLPWWKSGGSVGRKRGKRSR